MFSRQTIADIFLFSEGGKGRRFTLLGVILRPSDLYTVYCDNV